jgi:hypothetical protein
MILIDADRFVNREMGLVRPARNFFVEGIRQEGEILATV